MRGDVDIEGVDDALGGLAPEDVGHGGERLKRGGKGFVAALGVSGDGEVSRSELSGRGYGEFGVLIADAVEVEVNGSASVQAIGNVEADGDFAALAE